MVKFISRDRLLSLDKECDEKYGTDHLRFQGEYEGHEIHIRIPRGSWNIMDALVPNILKHVLGDIVEIGMGESSTVLAIHAEDFNVKLHSCDLKMGGMFNVFEKELFEDHICFIGKSEEFIKEYDGNPSIVFLDGEHNYDVVKMELDFFLPRLKNGGVIFMHDTMPPVESNTFKDKYGWNPGDVYMARRELERNPEVDVFTWPYSALNQGLTMVMKHRERTDYWKLNGRIDHIHVKQKWVKDAL